MQIKLNLKKELFTEKFYPLLFDYSHRTECYMGSAGSGKSVFITQKLILRALREQIKILICRRYATTLRNSCFSLFKEILTRWKIISYIKINESDMRIKFPNGSEILFIGLDDENKLLSINDIGTIFVEEAFEITQDLYEQLNLRMRGHNNNQQILMSWNPINKHHWLYEFTNNLPESALYIHSTYKDNRFLSKEYIQSLEELRIRNPQKARIFCDGEWGMNTDALVFHNWEIKEVDVSGYEHRAGMDFGFNDPSAIIESFYNKEKKEIYISNEFYQSGKTLDELYNAIVKMHLEKTKMYCDSAEPRTIDFLRRKHLAAYPCIKGQNSVEARIMFLQNHKLIVNPKCINMITELENFSYLKDNKTGEYIDDKYTHEFSHAIDALGYAYSDIYTKSKMRTVSKDVLGL